MSSREDILAALTSDSSIDGCDSDWRQEVLNDASSDDLNFVWSQIGCNDETDSETDYRLRRSGYY